MIDQVLEGLLQTSPPEAVSVVFGLLYSILAVRRTRWCWVAGGISSGILIVLSWQGRLPMQALLQAYYVGMSVYGFWHWSREDNAKTPVTTWPLRAHLIAWAGIVALSLLSSRYLTKPDAGGMAVPRFARDVGQSAGHLVDRAGQAGKLALLDLLRRDFGLSLRRAGTPVRGAAPDGVSHHLRIRVLHMAPEPARARALGLIPEAILAHVPGFAARGARSQFRAGGAAARRHREQQLSRGYERGAVRRAHSQSGGCVAGGRPRA